MTSTRLGLPTDAQTLENIRSSPEELRRALVEVAREGTDVWVAPLEDTVEALYDVARVDLCLARLVEGHCDGLRIIDQAAARPEPGVYGVWASKSVGTGLTGSESHGKWTLTGELRFASGVDLIDRALVPVRLDDDHSQLLDVPANLGSADPTVWRTTGMDAARTFTLRLDGETVQGRPIGPPNFYLERPGFVVGGLCVAAVWAGGVRQLLEVVAEGVRAFPTTQHQQRRLGAIEEAAWIAGRVLRSTVASIGTLEPEETGHEIGLARTAIVHACETALTEAGQVVGPAGLSRNARLARLMQDLAIYIRQHHLDGVLAAAGERALKSYQPYAG